MTATRKVRITLAEDQLALMKAAVESGEYASTSEIVSEAISDWQQKRGLRPEAIAALRQLWDEGKSSGSPVPLDFDELKQEAWRQLDRQKKTRDNAG
jgi:antitoxin ParD1/3/4